MARSPTTPRRPRTAPGAPARARLPLPLGCLVSVVTVTAPVLIENVKHHMEEEEQDWLPKVRKGLSRTTLQEIGARMIEVRKTAPRSPAQPSALKKVVDAVIA